MIRIANIRNLWRKILKFGMFIPVSNLVLLYGRRLLPDKVLDYIFNKRNKIIERRIEAIARTSIVPCPSLRPEAKAAIWFFWMQGTDNMPPISRLCLQFLRKNAGGHPVIVLDKNNINDYVQIPDCIFHLLENGCMTMTHFSDILRLALLSEHGGFWVDATMLVVKPLPETIFDNSFFTIKNSPQGRYVSKCRWTGFCIASWVNNPLMRHAYQMLIDYWMNTDVQIDYFIIDYIFDILYDKSREIKDAIDNVPYSNERLHDLDPILCKDFDKEVFSDLTRDTYMFKLSWKTHTADELAGNKNNYYNYLLRSIDG